MEEPVDSTMAAAAAAQSSPPHVLDPAIAASRLSLDLRVRLLEALVGLDTPAARRVNALEMSVARRGQHIVTSVHEAVEKNGSEAIKRFLENCAAVPRPLHRRPTMRPLLTTAIVFTMEDDANKPLLVPQLSAAASHTDNALSGEELGPHAKAALILDAEQDIRSFERELRDIDILEKRGAAGAGKLAGGLLSVRRIAEPQTTDRSCLGSQNRRDSRQG